MRCIAFCFANAAKAAPDRYVVPIPVAYLRERGCRVENGVAYIDVPYDSTFGVDIDDKYYGGEE